MSARYHQQIALLILLILIPGPACSQDSRKPDVPWEPSPHEVVTAMLKLAEVGEDDIVYDLGCGDGRIVIAAARDFGARGVGIDIDPRRITQSVENAQKAGVTSRVEFREEDLFEADFHDATVVTLFLWPSVNLKLRPILFQQLKPGTRVVSYIHNMGGWEPEKEITVNRKRVYLWTIPANKSPQQATLGK